MNDMDMKKIRIINTGGTFSSRPSEKGLVPELTGRDISHLLDEFSDSVSAEIQDYCALDSANILPSDWHNLAESIASCAHECDGVVIIHGTDTMAYTASMLSFMLLNIPIPVVMTGSQMPLGVPMSDAEDNFRCAMWMAMRGAGGVYIAFNRKILLGCRTSKVRTISFDAFESINYPAVGEVNAFGLHLRSMDRRADLPFAPDTRYSNRIAVLKLFPGMPLDIFRLLRDRGYEGIYVEGFGLGGVPFRKHDMTAEIRKASDEGLPILVGSQCRYEGSNLTVYETGRRILDCGGIPVHDMTQESVVAKLMWCLGQTKRRDDVCRIFSQNICDEITLG